MLEDALGGFIRTLKKKVVLFYIFIIINKSRDMTKVKYLS